jgi:hypothetical protein
MCAALTGTFKTDSTSVKARHLVCQSFFAAIEVRPTAPRVSTFPGQPNGRIIELYAVSMVEPRCAVYSKYSVSRPRLAQLLLTSERGRWTAPHQESPLCDPARPKVEGFRCPRRAKAGLNLIYFRELLFPRAFVARLQQTSKSWGIDGSICVKLKHGHANYL